MTLIQNWNWLRGVNPLSSNSIFNIYIFFLCN
nr:MAG TPA: hypothetical protein [Caudoviricetes sp.]